MTDQNPNPDTRSMNLDTNRNWFFRQTRLMNDDGRAGGHPFQADQILNPDAETGLRDPISSLLHCLLLEVWERHGDYERRRTAQDFSKCESCSPPTPAQKRGGSFFKRKKIFNAHIWNPIQIHMRMGIGWWLIISLNDGVTIVGIHTHTIT